MTAKNKSQSPVKITKNYRLFSRDGENRPLDMGKRKLLIASMKKHGFLPCYPIVCYRNGNKILFIKDGQHRLAVAESLELPVYWMETLINFDVAQVNCTQKTWQAIDYARKYADNGVVSYQKGLAFVEQYRLPVSRAFALLAGTVSYGNIKEAFVSGKFKIKDKPWAESVASLYLQTTALSPGSLRNATFLGAIMAVCRVKEFNPERFLKNAKRCRDRLVSYSTRDAYLTMMEEVYNFGRKTMLGLKSLSIMAMRDRDAIKTKK